LNPAKNNAPTFQELILRLSNFFADYGCVLQQPHDLEVGAGTMTPETFLRVLGPQPYKVAYLQPSRRPADGRYGENPNRLYKHNQLQVILKPPPEDVQELYLRSLEAIGIDLRQHDIKFEEDNWESPTLGAWGIGWQVMLDGLEITQFTYFQQCGQIDLDPISAELTYGLERIAAFLQDVDSIYQIVWARDPKTGKEVTYGDVRLADELQFSRYNFEAADVEKAWKHLELYEAECKGLIEILIWHEAAPTSITFHWNTFYLLHENHSVEFPAGTFVLDGLQPGQKNPRFVIADWQTRTLRLVDGNQLPAAIVSGGAVLNNAPLEFFTSTIGGAREILPNLRPVALLPALDLCLKCSHLFNILDARGAISVTERVGVIARIRQLAVGVAKAWVAQQGAVSHRLSAISQEKQAAVQRA